MAPKKKASEVEKMKEKLAEDALAVRDAARKAGPRLPVDGTRLGAAWNDAAEDVDALDKEFGEEEVLQKENFVDYLRSKLRGGTAEVRVMQIDPAGRLIDVTDKVKPQDLKPEDIGGVQAEDGRIVPVARNPRSREEAMRLLQEMLPGLRAASGASEAIRKMQETLAESDKILKHWK